MELEILKLIYDYSTKRKLVDAQFIDKLIEIVVTKRSLNSYVQNVQFTNKLKKYENGAVCATYNFMTHNICIDFESVQLYLENITYYDPLFCNLEQIMFRNLIITQIVLHELEHAYQNKQSNDKSGDSVEIKLINACLMLERAIKNPKFLKLLSTGEISKEEYQAYALKKRLLYKEYYEVNPIERLAEINSSRIILNSIEPVKGCIPSLYEFKQALLMEKMLKGYPDYLMQGTCPTQVYLFGTGQENTWYNFDFYNPNFSQLIKNVRDKYNLNERLTLGLPVKDNEYDKISDWLQSTNKYNI